MRLILLLLTAVVALPAQVINAGSATDQYFTGGTSWPSPVLRYGNFSYQIPEADGEYLVSLTFVEPSLGPGLRKFDVTMNGVAALTDYDISAVAGVLKPVTVVTPVTVAGSGILIRFVTKVRNAVVSTIRVERKQVPAPQSLTGPANALPASCPAGGLAFYSSTDTNELWWCAASPWVKLTAKVSTTGTGNIAVVGITATQAILAYAAPDATTPCLVEVSESASYRPLVHDVDPSLFPGSDSGSTGSVPGGLARVAVIGKRITDSAGDGNNYSRALQANTPHFARVTCGTSVRTAAFTTATILGGTSYNDGPQVDHDRPGAWKMPTRLEDRGQTIVDPQTGALLHAISIATEGGLPNFNGIFLGYGGFTRPCEPRLVGPAAGPLGFVCTFLRYGQGGGVAYWIVPSTGEARLLGSVPITGGGALGNVGSDLRSYGPDNSGNTIWVNYTGGFAPSKELPVSGWNNYSSVPANQLVHDFDPAFPVAGSFNCGRPWAGAGEYVLVVCGSGQDLPGWLAVLYGGDGRPIAPGCTDGDACPRVVAAADVFHIPATLNCTLHNVQQMGDVVSINVQLQAGAPRCSAMGNMVYWRFKTDPHGSAMVVDKFFDGGGHWDHGPLGRVSETGSGWGAVVGSPPESHLNEPYNVGVEDSPFFAGARGLSWGSTTSKHPSYHQVAGVAPASEQGWLLDMLPFDGGQFYSPDSGASLISGQLYKYNLSTEQPSAKLARKQLATLAVSGGRALVDISGPGSRLGDTADDSFKYCHTLIANECRQGAVPGDIFVNAPAVSRVRCMPSDGPVPNQFDLCIGNMGAYHQAMVQADLTGNSPPRVITYGLAGIRNSFYYSTAKSLPDASWALFSWGVVQPGFGDLTNVWMAKLPPLVNDRVDRSTFTRMAVALSAPAGTATAAVEFGYLEQGEVAQHYCSSRREACVATGTVTDAAPFFYASEGAGWQPCGAGCTVQVPVIPGHVVYYRAIFRDNSGKTIAAGPEQVSAP